MFAKQTLVLSIAATGALSMSLPTLSKARDVKTSVPLDESVINSAAYEVFLKSNVVLPATTSVAARDTVTPDNIFVLMCDDAGFRGDCLVFGAPPGTCVSFFDFNSPNSTEISDRFNHQVSSLSVNTGGNCMYFHYEGCNVKGDDRGLTSSYNYNLAVALPSDPRTVEYENAITSWRC